MCLEEYKASLMEFTEDELRAWTQFDQWEQQRGTKLAVDEYRIPLSRPQGNTVKIPNGRIEDCDVFSQNNQIALSKHPRYYTAVSHSHTFFEVMMVCNGTCRQWVEDRAMVMGQGEVCILPPGIRHAPEAFSPRDIILNLQIKRDAFHAMFHGLPEEQITMTEFLERAFADKPDAFLLVNTQNVPILQQLLLEMYWEYQTPDSYMRRILELQATLFFQKLLRYTGNSVRLYLLEERCKNEAMIPVLLFMQEHLDEISVEMLSEEFHYSGSQLARMFRRYTGKTYSACLREFRLEHAVKLLSDTDISIPEVARQSGFHNESNFYRQFREQYGQTPQRYRIDIRRT